MKLNLVRNGQNVFLLNSAVVVDGFLFVLLTARPEENGVEATPLDKGSDRGRRARGSRGRRTKMWHSKNDE